MCAASRRNRQSATLYRGTVFCTCRRGTSSVTTRWTSCPAIPRPHPTCLYASWRAPGSAQFGTPAWGRGPDGRKRRGIPVGFHHSDGTAQERGFTYLARRPHNGRNPTSSRPGSGRRTSCSKAFPGGGCDHDWSSELKLISDTQPGSTSSLRVGPGPALVTRLLFEIAQMASRALD